MSPVVVAWQFCKYLSQFSSHSKQTRNLRLKLNVKQTSENASIQIWKVRSIPFRCDFILNLSVYLSISRKHVFLTSLTLECIESCVLTRDDASYFCKDQKVSSYVIGCLDVFVFASWTAYAYETIQKKKYIYMNRLFGTYVNMLHATCYMLHAKSQRKLACIKGGYRKMPIA